MEQIIRQALAQISDPEVGENIVDLGLIYDITVTEDVACITMTMTSPSCPMGEMIIEEIRNTMTAVLPDSMALDINMVWEPAWSPDMMSAAAKQRLGWR
ncbi:metal-sulfur cluster assembly factor [Methylophaga sp. OBS4]|uniref:metal-sulfur cluster assembly factor n=1 Tax=Methylophaga sp. OBS4 TaxID=2991935 RepID=UPI00224E0B5A|nr:metal-sulfur cluster assembly factor [Methylophaga sp. OBS4]MCX4186719.1 metal-sulfur cluster assembly factor [Methylophaga sp. OBS4]